MKKILLLIFMLLFPIGVFAEERELVNISDLSIDDELIKYSIDCKDLDLANYDVVTYVALNNNYFVKVDKDQNIIDNVVSVNVNNIEFYDDDIIFIKAELIDKNKKSVIKSNIISNKSVQYRMSDDNLSVANILVRFRPDITSLNNYYYGNLGVGIVLCSILVIGLFIVFIKFDN